MRNLAVLASLIVLLLTGPLLYAQNQADPKAGLYSVGTTTLGATAKGSGAPWNKSWPAINSLIPGHGRPLGSLFGGPMTGARTDIRLVLAVDIKGVELFGLDYHFTRQVSDVDILVDGVKVKSAKLPERPGKGNFVALDAHGQVVSIVVTGEHPLRKNKQGGNGPTYGGWNRIRVYSSTDVPALMSDVQEYQVSLDPAFIAPTGSMASGGETKVYGQPRVATGHPKTIWDQVDIDHYKAMLKTSEELAIQYQGLKKAMDQRMTQPLGIPQPRKNEAGEYVHVSDRETGGIHNNLALDIANFGTVYVLSGEQKYAEFAKKLLLAYADAYPNYGVGSRAGFNHDASKVFDQRLGDATWLIQVARGYDLIYNSPMSDSERSHIENDLIRASARFIAANSAHLRGATNWSAIGTCAIFISGVATDDQDLIDTALWGINKGKSQGKWWLGDVQKRPSGMELHFSGRSIDADGMWAEGAMGYQFMAMQALIADAEILWHMGIDMYRYRDAALKRLFDSPLQYSYPNLRTPAIHDSGHGSIVGRESYLYEFGYKRYRDPKYLVILDQTGSHLGAAFQQFTVSTLYDLDLDAASEPVEWDSINFFGVGYGILRNTTERGTVSALIDYGPNRSHGHPDKLNLDLWAFGERLLPDPGSIWYEQPLYRNWYHTTVAHNTLVVDELEQRACGAQQIVYGPAESFGLQRARTNGAYSGVLMDRAIFVTPDYTADIFGAFARLPRCMELAWHPLGELQNVDLEMQPYSFAEPVEKGYNSLANVRAIETDSPYRIAVENKATPVRLLAAGGQDTTVILGDGHLGLTRPPTVLQRRNTNQSIWANVIDYSGGKEDYVRKLTQSGSLDEGYGLLEIDTADGDDLCYVSYDDTAHSVGDMTTDARQVFIRRKGGDIRSAYLGGGSSLVTDGLEIKLSKPALAYVERTEAGTYLVGNPSATDSQLTLTMPLLAGMKVFSLDSDGRRTGQIAAISARGTLGLTMKAASRIEISSAGVDGMFAHRTAMLRRRALQQQADAQAVKDAAIARTRVREADAVRYKVPPKTVVIVQGEDFVAEGNGKIRISSQKRNSIGKAILGWDAIGHWIEWKFTVPADGYYHLAMLYCSEQDQALRELKVNGQLVDEYMSPSFPSTGGWSNSSDDWRLYLVGNPVAEHPLLIKCKRGENTIRLTNANGRGINIDYMALYSGDVVVTREILTDMQRGN